MRKALRKFFSTMSTNRRITSRGRYFINPLENVPPTEAIKNLSEATVKPILQDVLLRITSKFKPTPKNAEDGLYLGTTGVAYMFYHLSKVPELNDQRNAFLQSAIEYLQPALQTAGTTQMSEQPSFMLGNGGVYAVAAAVYHAAKNYEESKKYTDLYLDAGNICRNPDFLSCGSNELFVGRAGYLCGALFLEKELDVKFNKDDLYQLCRITVESGREYARRRRSSCPLMYAYYNVEYLGAGHGLASILLYLLCCPGYLDANPKDARDVKAAVDYLLTLQDGEGNFPTATDEIGSDANELVHWCHGAGGMVYLFAKAYRIWNERKYLDSVLRSGELIWSKGLLKKGPGICHGVAGNGYVFLLLYRLTGDRTHVHRANHFFEFMYTDEFQKKARTPDNPYSLYEGLAGTACFIGDLLNPDKAAFPFMDFI